GERLVDPALPAQDAGPGGGPGPRRPRAARARRAVHLRDLARAARLPARRLGQALVLRPPPLQARLGRGPALPPGRRGGRRAGRGDDLMSSDLAARPPSASRTELAELMLPHQANILGKVFGGTVL